MAGACRILRHLIACGNRAAAKRYLDLKQMCETLGASFDNANEPPRWPATEEAGAATEGVVPVESTEPGPGEGVPGADASHGGVGSGRGEQQYSSAIVADAAAEPGLPRFDWGQAASVFFGHEPPGPPDRGEDAPYAFGFGGEECGDTIGFGDDDFALTGVIETDWEELSRQIAISMPPSPR